MNDVDTIVIGSGLAGLSVAALLARDGERVRVLEAHQHPGGYGHTFQKGAWRFCAELHYVFDAGEGETIGRFFAALGLEEEVRFRRLDPEGFDHVVVAGERYRIPNGLAKHRDRLIGKFPDEERGLRAYFALLAAVRDELGRLPEEPTPADWLRAPLRIPHVLRHRRATLADVFDRLGLSPRLRTILAGQCGDYLMPPSRASFLVHALVTTSYDRGAHYPVRHFAHFVDAIVGAVTSRPGCEVRLGQRVEAIEVEGDRVVSVRTEGGELHTARRFISNADPRATALLVGLERLPSDYRAKLDYEYSCSCITLFLGLTGIDLRDHGFGSFSVWHYPDDDVDGAYERQLARGDFTDPWLFLSTPSLHSDAPGLAPPGGQVLCVATSAAGEPFISLRRERPEEYRDLKHRVVEQLLDVVESRYVPGLRGHIAMLVAGTPATNARIVGAPHGNAYGVALGPRARRIPMRTPIENLWLCNATAGWPSVAGTIASGMRLHRILRGSGP